MAKKLGKKARKFAKKKLQVVEKRKRKLRSLFKRKSAPRSKSLNREASDDDERVNREKSTEGLDDSYKNSDRIHGTGSTSYYNLDNLFSGEEEGLNEDDFSDSDGYLSEDPDCPYISEDEIENNCKDECGTSSFQQKNKEINQEILKKKKKLDRLLQKDPEFASFLESKKSDLENYGGGSSDEEIEEESEDEIQGDGKGLCRNKTLTGTTIDVWCWLVTQNPSGPALRNLLNAYRDASLYGFINNSNRIINSEVFSKILNFVLSESDGIFRELLSISGNVNPEKIVQRLKNLSEWKSVGPLVRSYLRSSIGLLNQVSDNEILVFVLSRIRASVVLFSAFPSLVRRLIKILVHLWATGDQTLSLASFSVIREITSLPSQDFVNICFKSTYKSFISNCKIMENDTNIKHTEFLMNSLVELYSLDMQISYRIALLSLCQLAMILKSAVKTKKMELHKIHNWQYMCCINLWVKYVNHNYKENDLNQLISTIIKVIFGVAHLFTGPCYQPLRIKCVKLLNQLSLSTGIFIPVSSLVFDCLEFGRENGNSGGEQNARVNLSILLKAPKSMLKSREFHEKCVMSAVELLSEHFKQWSFHISFPELSTIPLSLFKQFHERTKIEGLRCPVKQLIDQVEQNRDFIQRKRDEVSFSRVDQSSVDNFLLLEKRSAKYSFSQFYSSVLQNSHNHI